MQGWWSQFSTGGGGGGQFVGGSRAILPQKTLKSKMLSLQKKGSGLGEYPAPLAPPFLICYSTNVWGNKMSISVDVCTVMVWVDP